MNEEKFQRSTREYTEYTNNVQIFSVYTVAAQVFLNRMQMRRTDNNLGANLSSQYNEGQKCIHPFIFIHH